MLLFSESAVIQKYNNDHLISNLAFWEQYNSHKMFSCVVPLIFDVFLCIFRLL